MRVQSSLEKIRQAIDPDTVEFSGALWYLINHHEAQIQRRGRLWKLGVRLKPEVIMIDEDGDHVSVNLTSDDLLSADWLILEKQPVEKQPTEINFRPKAGDVQR